MIQNYQDAMAICRWAGYPDLFLTFTCNPKWPEIVRHLEDLNKKPEDRPDIVVRVFKTKLDELMKDLKNNRRFGQIVSAIYTIEFQKRGLPHAHILLFLAKDDKHPTGDDIDKIISAEIPEESKDPKYHVAVRDYMVHGPCGHLNKKSPCMIGSKCSKHFPKKLVDVTNVDSDGYPVYRRRDNGRYIEKNGIPVNNGWIVPHNRYLLITYGGHLNVEWCNQSRSIKYLFKYINKGHDRVTANFYKEKVGADGIRRVDEIDNFYDCRYVSPCEAAWRLFKYEIQYKYPPVERLSIHLPGQKFVIFKDNDRIEEVIDRTSMNESKFEGWFALNVRSELARSITYVECPQHFVWQVKDRYWKKRDKGFALGRIYYVHPGAGEIYYLRLLLNVRTGCKSYEELKFVGTRQYTTFRDACYALGLLEDDNEYVDAITEASAWASGKSLRALFATLLTSDCLTNPLGIWEKTWPLLIDGILYNQRILRDQQDLSMSDKELQNICLIEIDDILRKRGKKITDYSNMPELDYSSFPINESNLIMEELQYDKNEMQREFHRLYSLLNEDQNKVYHTVIDAVNMNNGGLYFVYGYGGTGKTFVWKTLSSSIRAQGEIVLNVASSGIASLLLPGGRTAHSRFKIPINVNEDSTCMISVSSPLADLLVKCKLIIWDEAPMMHKHCFECLDRTLKDIMKSRQSPNYGMPFGGKVLVLGGDFRQILPVVTKGSRQDIVNASINSSHLWNDCTILHLTKNMRLEDSTLSLEERNQMSEFSDWISKIGDGIIGEANDGIVDIDIPSDLLLNGGEDPIGIIVDEIYPHYIDHYEDSTYFTGRAILAPTLAMVDLINDHMVGLNPLEKRDYLSSDNACRGDAGLDMNLDIQTPEILNSLKCSGMPNHHLMLKVGTPVMLLRNIDHSIGLCNGTRLLISRLSDHVIEAKIISGQNTGEVVLLPRITLSPSETKFPFKFQRRQFPIIVSYAMTINKSQGQSLSNVGLFLRNPVFTHCQLYVAASRVTNRKGLKILICDERGDSTSITKNVVYREVFQNL